MDTQSPLNPAFDENDYIYVVVDHSSNYMATVQPPKKLLNVL